MNAKHIFSGSTNLNFRMQIRLKTLKVKGLWSRLNPTNAATSRVVQFFMYAAIAIAAPFIIYLFPVDTICLTYQVGKK